jgi:hypothetical protein
MHRGFDGGLAVPAVHAQSGAEAIVQPRMESPGRCPRDLRSRSRTLTEQNRKSAGLDGLSLTIQGGVHCSGEDQPLLLLVTQELRRPPRRARVSRPAALAVARKFAVFQDQERRDHALLEPKGNMETVQPYCGDDRRFPFGNDWNKSRPNGDQFVSPVEADRLRCGARL